jgi:hypothetical protein
VIAEVRYLRLLATRTRAPLLPLAGCVFAVAGVFGYDHNEVGKTWGLTAVLCCALAAWVVGAILAAEPEPQAAMATAALGGRAGRRRMELVLAGLVTIGLAVAFVGYPLLEIAAGVSVAFDRPVQSGDVVAGVVSQLCGGMLGATLAMALGPPRIVRRATSAAAVMAVLIALVAMPAVAGPAAVAQAMTDARPGAVEGPEALAWASCLALAAAVLALAQWWTRRRP